MNCFYGRLERLAAREGSLMKSFRLPEALQSPDDQLALSYLRRYYKERLDTPLGADFTGARFDIWDSRTPARRMLIGSPPTT